MKRFLFTLAAGAAIAACGEPPRDVTSPLTPGGEHAARTLSQADGSPVMTNLANPRALAWGPDGGLYVAEAGRGGTGPCMLVLGATVCYGPTGAVSRLTADGEQERVITGLPSWVTTSNLSGRAQGPSGIAFHGMGGAYVTVGLEANPSQRTAPELMGFGQLVHLAPSALVPANASPHSGQKWEFVADLGQYEVDANPDCGDLDSNPYGVLADGNQVLVADAGGNYIARRAANGELSTFAVFSNNTTVPGAGCPAPATRDFVPTSIVRGPDSAYYIGHLNGLPILAGSSSVWRVEQGGTPTVYCGGFTWIIGLAFAPNGDLYVLQHSDGPATSSPGSLRRVTPSCVQTTVVSGLSRPTGIALDTLGNVYLSVINGSNFAAEGQVRRFTP